MFSGLDIFFHSRHGPVPLFVYNFFGQNSVLIFFFFFLNLTVPHTGSWSGILEGNFGVEQKTQYSSDERTCDSI